VALVACPDCQAQISPEAPACPHCGRPNKKVATKAKDGRQSAGCAVMIGGVILSFFSPPLGGLIIVVGLIYTALNTRFS
jgi:hypothetical protein